MDNSQGIPSHQSQHLLLQLSAESSPQQAWQLAAGNAISKVVLGDLHSNKDLCLTGPRCKSPCLLDSCFLLFWSGILLPNIATSVKWSHQVPNIP